MTNKINWKEGKKRVAKARRKQVKNKIKRKKRRKNKGAR